MSFAEFLKKYAQREPEHIRAMATGFVEGFNATDRNKVSARFLKAAQSAGDAIDEMKAYRLHAGYDRVPGYLLAGLDPAGATVHLSTAAQVVRWSKGSVQVTARGPAGDERRYRGKAAVIALPLGVLQADPGEEGAVAFDPPVPEVRRARDRMAMGPVIKVVARFAEPFWEGRVDLRDLCFLHAPGEAFPTFWTSLPVRATVLTGWAGGPAAERLAGQSPPGVLDAFLTTVAKSLGIPKRRVASLLQSWHVADWQSDPWSRGAYSYALVGGAGAPAAMARPVAGTLFFAGEHTHPGETGTVAAAIESGQRAAHQVISYM